MSEDIERGIALVTGAASGMGRAAAILLAEAGWPLLLCDTNEQRLGELANSAPRQAETLAGDISEEGYCDRLVSILSDRRIGALIHCAGLSPTMGTPERILEVNLAATMRLVDAVRPRMARGGAVVLFASSAAHQVGDQADGVIDNIRTPGEVIRLMGMSRDSGAAYSISKRGVLRLARREAKAFGERGARIVSLSPGVIDTPMGRAEMEDHPIMRAMVEHSALGRPALAEEVASVAVFLCSPAASFITGTDILVDGGGMASPPPRFG